MDELKDPSEEHLSKSLNPKNRAQILNFCIIRGKEIFNGFFFIEIVSIKREISIYLSYQINKPTLFSV